MPRDYEVYLADILDAVGRITASLKRAVLYFASGRLSGLLASARQLRTRGLRDILIHQYFGIDVEIVWDVIGNKLPALREHVRNILGPHPSKQ